MHNTNTEVSDQMAQKVRQYWSRNANPLAKLIEWVAIFVWAAAIGFILGWVAVQVIS